MALPNHAISIGFLIICIATISEGLLCYTCNSANSNEACNRARNLKRCPFGNQVCANVVRLENGLLRITKGCLGAGACRAGSIQNSRQCTPIVRSFLNTKKFKEESKNLPPSVCRSCCSGDRCNTNLYLKEAQRNGPGVRPGNVWRQVRPSIRNIKFTHLTSDKVLITFIDLKNNSASFFNVGLLPYSKAVQVVPVFVNENSIPGLKIEVPKGTIAYLATRLSAGKRYRISITSKTRSVQYSQRIFTSFTTRPRPPRGIRVAATDITGLTLHVLNPAYGRGDRFNFFALSYRKASSPVSETKRIPIYDRSDLKVLRNLEPSTAYIIHAWTLLANDQGKLITRSSKINITAYTDVPSVENVEVDEVHATNMTWKIEVPQYYKQEWLQEFVVGVRDDTHAIKMIDTTIPATRRSFTITGLEPQNGYSCSVTAKANNRESKTVRAKPTFTKIRCFSCLDASSRTSCNQFIECPAESGGCLNEVRRRSFSHAADSGWYRASLKCKQVKACNNSEEQDKTQQCNPSRDRNIDPPKVCRCCCEGDLCNGPGGNCGHILGWLTPFRSPPKPTKRPPPFCSAPAIQFGSFSCSNGLEIGSVCSFKCDEDRRLVGDARISCYDNGKWSASFPTCVPLGICTVIPESQGTNYTCTKGYQSGSVCRITCEKDYRLGGENQIRCNVNGRWSQEYIPTCLKINDCQPNPCLNQATCHDLVNGYECECVPGWTGRHCEKEVICEKLTSPENGKLQCTNGNRYGSRCRYSCNKGYEQHGSKYTRCLEDGYWREFKPTLCVVKTCDVLPQTLVNGGVTECSGYRVGDHCNFTCPAPFAVTGGLSSVTCQDNKTWSGVVPCCDLSCPPHARVDLFFLLDSSSSVGDSNWKLLINFTLAVLDEFSIGPNDMVVGAARYNRYFDYRSQILFGNYEDENDLKRKISNIPYNGRGTYTGRALRHLDYYSLNRRGNRPDAPDIIVVITDGKAQDPVKSAAKRLQNRNQTTVYAVGVSNRNNELNVDELNSIASGPRYMHVMDGGYEQLVTDFKNTLANDVCRIPCQYKYERWELEQRQREEAAKSGVDFDAEFWSQFDANTTASPSTTVAATTKPETTEPKVTTARPTIPPEPEVKTTRPFIPPEPEEEVPVPVEPQLPFIPKEPAVDQRDPFPQIIEEEES